jgi:hypothetical protein
MADMMAVSELLLDQRLPGRAVHHDQLKEAVDQRVGGWRRSRERTLGCRAVSLECVTRKSMGWLRSGK